MTRVLLPAVAALAAIAAVSGPAAAPAQKAASAARDWTRTVEPTADGGYRIGNPAAPVKLVEYGSLTCNHCADFAQQGLPNLLAKYVKSGRVSFEFRNFVRDPADMAASLLSRCAATESYFALTDRYFRNQPQWLGKFQGMTEAQAQAIDALPPAQRIPRFAALGGLDAIAARDGVTPAKARACLADPKAIARLAEMRRVALETHGLKGTPTFLINGRRAEGAFDWATVEPLLGPPGG